MPAYYLSATQTVYNACRNETLMVHTVPVPLRLNAVSRRFGVGPAATTALADVDLTLQHGSFTAIMGPSGSGKTTLLNIVGGLDHYDSGNLIIDQISTEQYRDRDWDTYRNNRVGFVFQSYNLIPIKVCCPMSNSP